MTATWQEGQKRDTPFVYLSFFFHLNVFLCLSLLCYSCLIPINHSFFPYLFFMCSSACPISTVTCLISSQPSFLLCRAVLQSPTPTVPGEVCYLHTCVKEPVGVRHIAACNTCTCSQVGLLCKVFPKASHPPSITLSFRNQWCMTHSVSRDETSMEFFCRIMRITVL